MFENVSSKQFFSPHNSEDNRIPERDKITGIKENNTHHSVLTPRDLDRPEDKLNKLL